MIALLLGLLLTSQIVIVGPGALGYTPVLEAVANRRLVNNWGLTGDWQAYDILAAPSDCRLLDKSGWLIVEGEMMTVKVVDCEQAQHKNGGMSERGLLADVNREELAHRRAWMVLR